MQNPFEPCDVCKTMPPGVQHIHWISIEHAKQMYPTKPMNGPIPITDDPVRLVDPLTRRFVDHPPLTVGGQDAT
jgi:hypothetical protein